MVCRLDGQLEHPHGASAMDNYLLASILGGVFIIALIAILGGLLQARRERWLVHTERMKALELGVGAPDEASIAHVAAPSTPTPARRESESPAHKSFTTAFFVAFFGLGAAAFGPGLSSGVGYAIAASVGAISVTAIICGTILATRRPSNYGPTTYAKPEDEPDELDVVSSRG
jgi:hypothetical protein